MRNAIRATLLSAGTFLAMTSPTMAWDYPGHRIVGAIADSVLQQHHPKTYQRVSELLDKKDAAGNVVHRSLREVSVFADCAKKVSYCGRKPSGEEKAYTKKNPEHDRYHYTDVPIEQHAYKPDTAGTRKIDVVRMLDFAVARLRGNNPAPPKKHVKLTKAEAVWLIAHLVGDIHQPLHVGAPYYHNNKSCIDPIDPNNSGKPPPKFGIGSTIAETVGGNKIALIASAAAPPPSSDLHYFWDSATVAQAMEAAGVAGQEQAFAKQLAATPPSGWETEGGVETWPTRWATEGLAIAADAHTRLVIEKKSGATKCAWQTTLDKSYQDWASKQAGIQIAKAGFRLAALLVAIYEPQ